MSLNEKLKSNSLYKWNFLSLIPLWCSIVIFISTSKSFEIIIWNNLPLLLLGLYVVSVIGLVILMFKSNKFLELCQYQFFRYAGPVYWPKLGPILVSFFYPLLSTVPLIMSCYIYAENDYLYINKMRDTFIVTSISQNKNKTQCYHFKSLYYGNFSLCQPNGYWESKQLSKEASIEGDVVVGYLGIYIKNLRQDRLMQQKRE